MSPTNISLYLVSLFPSMLAFPQTLSQIRKLLEGYLKSEITSQYYSGFLVWGHSTVSSNSLPLYATFPIATQLFLILLEILSTSSTESQYISRFLCLIPSRISILREINSEQMLTVSTNPSPIFHSNYQLQLSVVFCCLSISEDIWLQRETLDGTKPSEIFQSTQRNICLKTGYAYFHFWPFLQFTKSN